MSTTTAIHLKPPAPPEQFEYKKLKQGEFWRHIPAYADVDEATFLDHLWQQQPIGQDARTSCSQTIRGRLLAGVLSRRRSRLSRRRRWPCAFRRTRSR